MAINFNILFQRKNGDLHIDLKGDFDGSSAKILCNALKRNCDEEQKVIVNTNKLGRIYRFGRYTFESDCTSLRHKTATIIFTGKYGHLFSAKRI